MKAWKKIGSVLLSTVLLSGCFATPQSQNPTENDDVTVEQTEITTPTLNAITAKKYSLEITQMMGGPTFFCNNTALTKGDSMTIEYTVQAKTCSSQETSASRCAGVFTKSSQAKAYPQVSSASNHVTAYDSFNINGADLNSTNAPNLPDTHFEVGATYQLSYTPQTGNATYTWTLKKNGTQMDTGSVAYDAYMGVMIYLYHNYRLTLTDVSVTTSSADLGVFAYNEGKPLHNTMIVDGDKEMPIVTLTQENIEVSGSTATVTSDMGYFGSNSIKLTAGNPQMYLYLDDLENYEASTRVHVSLRYYLECTTDSLSTTWYSPSELYKESGLYVDGDMPRNTWNHINYDTLVMERNGRKCVQLSVSGNAGEVMYISAPQVSADQTENKYTLGGCTVYQMEGNNLLQSYVIITPTDEVIVIDGGDVADADLLYNFLIQFTHKIDHWFVSHFHGDHCGALVTLLGNPNYDFQIKNLHYNFPTEAKCQAAFDYILSVAPGASDETPSMVSRKAVLDDKTNSKILNRVTSQMGQVFTFGDTCRFKVISNPDFEINTNYGNNTSLMYKLETAGENVLFLNDIGDTGDEYIRDNPTINYGNGIPSATFREEIADCAYVQLGHHGQNGPSLNFYNYCTDMRICLYAAPAWVMDCSNGSGLNSATNLVTLATRDFMREKGVYKYYSQEKGRVKLV